MWKTIKKFQALAFVPSDRVIDAFEELVTSSNPETDELLVDFLVYFETPWIGVVQRGRRHRSLFDIDLWNVHDRVEILPRNSIEGWHHACLRSTRWRRQGRNEGGIGG